MNILERLYSSLGQILENSIDFGFMLIVALIILLIGYIISKLISNGVKKIIDKLNAEKYMDKLREVDIFSGITLSLAEIIQKLVFWGLMLITIMLTVDTIGLTKVSDGINNALAYAPNILSALVFFIIGAFMANGLKVLIKNTCDSVGVSAGNMLSNIAYYFALIVVVLVALGQAGMEIDLISDVIMTSLTLAMLGLAIGFGISSKDLFSNMLGGFYSKDKFSIGQIIEIGEYKGEIIKIDSGAITLDLGDNKVVIPANELSKNKVIIHN